MEWSILVFVALIVAITAYAIYRLFKFFLTDSPSYEYRTVMDERGNNYDLAVNINDTKEKE